MKPNQEQIKTINSILSIIEDWKLTNDIDSPSHYTLIEEGLSDEEDLVLQDALHILFNKIKSRK